MNILQQQFASWLAECELELSNEQFEAFERYYKELVDWNSRMNLTAITEKEQVFTKHFYDSVALSRFVPLQQFTSLADIGSGAGFPSIPLKIMFPHLQVTIVDSLNKRIQFLNHLVQSLNLQGVTCIHGRAEEVARKAEYRDQFDMVTARAVARLNVLNEFCLPFVRPNGIFVAMKGSQADDELAEAKQSIRTLQAKLEEVHEMQLPEEEGYRQIIVLRKTGATPAKYPRKPGMPLRQPIV